MADTTVQLRKKYYYDTFSAKNPSMTIFIKYLLFRSTKIPTLFAI